MRKTLTAALLSLTWLTVAAQQPPSPTPRFRSQVELIVVDVVAVDKENRPVEDLRAGDFTVKVDGRNRPVVSAQLVKRDRSQAGPSVAERTDPPITSNDITDGGRHVVVAVDQTLIAPGSIMPLLRTATGFVDALAPTDYGAVLAFPEPGPRVDFTTDRTRLREACGMYMQSRNLLTLLLLTGL